MNFWSVVSRIILKGRIVILILIAAATYFLYTQTANIKFSHTEANLLPSDHPVNIEYEPFKIQHYLLPRNSTNGMDSQST